MATLNIGESVPFLSPGSADEATWQGRGLGFDPAQSVWRLRWRSCAQLGFVTQQTIDGVESVAPAIRKPRPSKLFWARRTCSLPGFYSAGPIAAARFA